MNKIKFVSDVVLFVSVHTSNTFYSIRITDCRTKKVYYYPCTCGIDWVQNTRKMLTDNNLDVSDSEIYYCLREGTKSECVWWGESL
jgi:hypothetical protein